MLDKIRSKKVKVCVVGLGYVGVPLAVASAEAGFVVVGVDVDKEKVSMINKGICYVEDAYSERHLPDLVRAGLISATDSLSDGATSSDILIVCVPTPLNAKSEPDLSFLRSVARGLSKNLAGFKLVIVESTSFPGTTKDIFQPLLERDGKKPEKDFALVYSPERIDYGNAKFGVRNIPKVVGGIDGESTQLGAEFYKAILEAPVVTVGSPSVAEATKMLENIFRYVNIALVNELAVLHETLGVDFIEAINAAATKPFGFMPHYPGPGVGGRAYESRSSEIESVRDADALIISTAHNVFRSVDLSKIRSLMRNLPILYDTRNLRDQRECEEAGFTYLATGRP